MRHFSLSIALLLGLVAAVPGQDRTFSVEENLEFSRGLIERRMHALAYSVLDGIRSSSTASDGEKAEANLEIANVYKDQFGRGANLEERLAASERADEAYQNFLNNFADHPRAVDAKLEYAEFLFFLGNYRTRLADETVATGGSTEDATQHRTIALTQLKKSRDLFEELIAIIDAMEREQRGKYAEHANVAKYYRAISYYFIAQAEADEADRTATFELAIGNLEEFIFENEANLRGYWGYLYKALCHREFNEEEHRADAIASFEGVIHAFESTIAQEGVGWDSWADVVADASSRELLDSTYWRFAETLRMFGRYDDAIKRVERLEAIHKETNAPYGSAGFQARLERAECYLLNGDVNGAIAVVSDVATEAAGNAYIQFQCNRLLARFLEEVDDKAKLDSNVVFKAAKGAYFGDRFNESVGHFYTVLAINKGVGDQAQECWDYISRSFRELGFAREAAYAAETAAFNYKTDRSLDLAKRARGLLTRIKNASRSKKDEERLEALKARMEQEFGGGGSSNYDPAVLRMQEGKYGEAARRFGAVQPDSDKYDLAQAYQAFCLVLDAELDLAKALQEAGRSKEKQQAARTAAKESWTDAIGRVDRFLAGLDARPIVGNPVLKSSREQAIGVALFAKANAQESSGDYDASLATIEAIEKAPNASASTLEKAAVLKAQAYLDKDDLKNAEKQLALLGEKFPGAQKYRLSMLGRLGLRWADEAEKLEKAKNRVGALQATIKSVEFRQEWIKGETSPSPVSLLSLGKDLFALNRFDEAKVYLEAVVDRFKDVKKLNKRQRTTQRLAKRYLGRILIWQGKYVEAKPLFEALYNENKRDLGVLREYAALLSGSVEEVDGNLVYVPGLGHHEKDAMAGFNLWKKIRKAKENKTTDAAQWEYLGARFHQDLVRWSLGKPELAERDIRALRVSLGADLDGGHWKRRFDWLERALRRKAPQTPPSPPKPIRMPAGR